MFIHPDVKAHGLSTNMVIALFIAHEVWKDQGADLVLRHALDGQHKLASLHYTGNAIDLRTWEIDAKLAAKHLQHRLGPEYDVVLEETHIHVEYQPKEPQ